ncbi:putative nucleoside-diphosphate-sugar epimerase [Halenospora varia]|nr:putative nucleoside-diphosphate-sugar epimerase [Halenospora varia]
MKLIVAGSTGFVATEVIRQAINNPAISSVVGLARRETAVPKDAGANASKFKSVICEDFSNYSEDTKKELAGANACIWTLAVTPSKARAMPFEQATRVCLDFTETGIETISPIASNPFRFIYISGSNAERDPTKKPWILGDYCLMRGKAESSVLDFAKKSQGAVEACVAKPGLIDALGRSSFIAGIGRAMVSAIAGVPKLNVDQIAASLIDQAIKGFEKETLLNEDMIRIGDKALGKSETSS